MTARPAVDAVIECTSAAVIGSAERDFGPLVSTLTRIYAEPTDLTPESVVLAYGLVLGHALRYGARRLGMTQQEFWRDVVTDLRATLGP